MGAQHIVTMNSRQKQENVRGNHIRSNTTDDRAAALRRGYSALSSQCVCFEARTPFERLPSSDPYSRNVSNNGHAVNYVASIKAAVCAETVEAGAHLRMELTSPGSAVLSRARNCSSSSCSLPTKGRRMGALKKIIQEGHKPLYDLANKGKENGSNEKACS